MVITRTGMTKGGHSKVAQYTQLARTKPKFQSKSRTTFERLAQTPAPSGPIIGSGGTPPPQTNSPAPLQSSVPQFTDLAQGSAPTIPQPIAPAATFQNKGFIDKYKQLAGIGQPAPPPQPAPEDPEAPYGRAPDGRALSFDETGSAAPLTASDIQDLLPVTGVFGLGIVKPLGKIAGKEALEAAAKISAKKAAADILQVTTKNTASDLLSKAAAATIEEGMQKVGQVAVNTKTAKFTSSFLGKILTTAGKTLVSPAGIMTIIGSYPFAMFIKEEALQTTGFAQKGAKEAGDLEALEAANAYNDQLLNPDVWHKIIGAVPIANNVQALMDYYKAAKLSTDTYKAVEEALRLDKDIENKVTAGTATPDEIAEYIERNPFSDIAKDAKDSAQEEERLSNEEYYKKLREEEAARKEADRQADEAYYAGIRAQKLADKAADRRADEAYYAGRNGGSTQVYSPRSSLNFGLLKTDGGYQTVNKADLDPSLAGQLITDPNEISNYFYSLPFANLTPEQRAVVEEMMVQQ